MKKTSLLALLLCLCMLLAACAASTSGTPANEKTTAPSAETSDTTQTAASEETSAAETTGETPLSGDIEVGILLAEGTAGYELIVNNVGNWLIERNPDLSIEYTFANTKARSFMEQKWRSGDAPDTDYFVFNAQVPSTYEFTDRLLDLKPYMESDEGWSKYKDSAMSIMELDGKIYGAITDTHVQGLYYNKAYFEQFGINPPEIWEDLLAACETLKSNGIDPIAVTGTYAPYMGAWLDYLMIREVGYDAAYEAIRNGTLSELPGVKRAVDKCKQLIDNGYFLQGFEGTDFTAAQMQFFQGKAGMILMGTWLTSEMADSIPADFQLGICPFPSVSTGEVEQTQITSHSNVISVNKDSENLDAAIAFVKRFTSEEVQTMRAEQTGLISAVEGVAAPTNVYGLGDLLDSATSMHVRHFALEFEADKNTAYYNEVAKLFMGQVSGDEFIANADAVMSALK